MSEVIGDTQHLHNNTIPFRVVRSLTGPHGSGAFVLFDDSAFAKLVNPYAAVAVVEQSLSTRVFSPPAPDKAITCHVATIPDRPGLVSPKTTADILTIAGSAYLESSLYSGNNSSALPFSIECAHQVKPKPVVGLPPRVVYSWVLQGGDATSVSNLVIEGTLRVDGAGFQQTW